MPWIPEQHMADIHIIRQDYARALNALEENHTNATASAFAEVVARRARAIRMLHEEDGISVRRLAAMFRCNKQVIREALAAKED